MSTEENKGVATRFIEEVWNRGRLEVADELLAADLVSHNQPPGETGTRETFMRYLAQTREQHPDLRIEIEDMIAEADKVASRVTVHSGSSAGGGGRAAIGIVRIVDGRIAEQWTDTAPR